MIKIYKQRLIDKKLNTYFICEGDKNYNIKKEIVNPSNPSCNCYSIAKAYVVLAIGILYDRGLLSLDTLIIDILKNEYPNAQCSLNFSTPFELVVAVALSAQCTDERVNIVTSEMFKKYNTPYDFANLDLTEIEKMIKPCGFYKNKAKNLKECSIKLINDFNGIVPNTMEELTTLAGIGRKSANVILLNAFNICVRSCSRYSC